MTGDELSADDAWPTARRHGLRALLAGAFVRFRYGDGFSHARAFALQLALAAVPLVIAGAGLASAIGARSVGRGRRADRRRDLAGPQRRAGGRRRQHRRRGHGARRGRRRARAGDRLRRGDVGVRPARTGRQPHLRHRARPARAPQVRPRRRPHRDGGGRDGRGAAPDRRGRAVRGRARGRLPLGRRRRDRVGHPALAGRASRCSSSPSPCCSATRRGAASRGCRGWRSARASPCSPWLAGSGLLAFYVAAAANFGDTYGPLTAVMALLLWANVTGIALLAGLALAAQLEAVRGGRPDPLLPEDRRGRDARRPPRRAEPPGGASSAWWPTRPWRLAGSPRWAFWSWPRRSIRASPGRLTSAARGYWPRRRIRAPAGTRVPSRSSTSSSASTTRIGSPGSSAAAPYGLSGG